MIRVLLADDHALFLDGIKSLFENEKGIKIIGETEDGISLVKKYFDLKPDIVVTDISMPNKSGPEAATAIINKDKNAKILFLSQHTDDNYIYEALKCKALGLIGKNIVKNELILAINAVGNGKHYFIGKTDKDLQSILNKFDGIRVNNGFVHVDSLTSRENEVLKAIGEGLSREEISKKLKISVRTFDSHKYNIMAELGIKNTTELVKYAVEIKRRN